MRVIERHVQTTTKTVSKCLVQCNEPRNITIYLMQNLAGNKQEEIGRECGINNHSSFSTISERRKQKAATDREFRKRIDESKLDLTVSKEQTPIL